MKLICLFVLSLSFLASCTMPASRVDEATIRRWLPGTWADVEERFGGAGFSFEKTYFADGTARGKAVSYHRSGGEIFYSGAVHFTSKWRVQGDILESYDVKCSQPGLFKPGDVFRDRILSIDALGMRYRDLTNGGVRTSKRWTGVDGDGKAMSRAVARAYTHGLNALHSGGLARP